MPLKNDCRHGTFGKKMRLSKGTFDYSRQETAMFKWAFLLGLIALVAAILGFSGLAGVLAELAIAIFVLALVLTLVLIFLGWKGAKAAASKFD